uniref:C2H2-type domain-containing protein n=1 Tax=Daphnia galeata TaxID=27404 RepID=A0A8J2RVF7_9CRUS|nr:unnamed protein product [Daphnia galeata]
MQQMDDQNQSWLLTKSTKINHEDTIIGDEKGNYHHKEIQLKSLPAWMTHADETCKDQIICKNYAREINVDHKRNINQMAPEELSLEDVQQLQKLNRELHAENIKKTLSSMMLEQDYNSLLDEIAVVRKDLKHWQECSGLMKLALSEICSNRKCAVPDIKREETIELKFLDVSSPKGSLRYPIGESDDLRQAVNQPYSFCELPSASVSDEVSPRPTPSIKNIDVLKPMDKIVPRTSKDFSHCPTDVLIDLSEDVKQLKVSSHFVPVSDEMSPRIKCSSSVKKKCVFNSEDELTPRLPKDFSHCSAESERIDVTKDVKQPQGSDEFIRVISPRPKIASAIKTINAINSTDAEEYFEGPPEDYYEMRDELKCFVCDIYLNSEGQLQQHFSGKRHNANYDEWLKLEKNK